MIVYERNHVMLESSIGNTNEIAEQHRVVPGYFDTVTKRFVQHTSK